MNDQTTVKELLTNTVGLLLVPLIVFSPILVAFLLGLGFNLLPEDGTNYGPWDHNDPVTCTQYTYTDCH